MYTVMKFIERCLVACCLLLLIADSVSAQKSFPSNITGNWKGKITWHANGREQQFDMQLQVHPSPDSAGQYSWFIFYGQGSLDARPYVLKAKDSVAGKWVIDEQNGIVLDGYAKGSSFHGIFTVQKNTIMDQYMLLPDGRLLVQFWTIDLQNKSNTGLGTEASPAVETYQVKSYQAGILEKL